ncbi:peroxidase superfamily protein [Tasmannia lanceolata]|uniref:peroxidase superfamily protein n=1 Tax=Tasmannia lanceolata TaxID=3420 RepID=UPI0040649627
MRIYIYTHSSFAKFQKTTKMSVPSSSFSPFFFLLLFLQCSELSNGNPNSTVNQLSIDFYSKSCPQLEQFVSSVTAQQFRQSPVSGPATIRLFFHDCFVEGCDASILLSSKPGSTVEAEKDAYDNKNLAVEAYDSVKKAKELVESKCPGVVSCADILALAARDFVHLAGGPYYPVKKGRRDGRVSIASGVKPNLPRANSTIDELLKLFASKGLSQADLVALSGAHTIGFSHCDQFVSRLYDFHGTKKPDPYIDPRLLKALQMSCPHFGGNVDVVAPFDVTTPFAFDHMYYGNLEAKLGLLATDQGLFLDPRTRPLVQALGKDKAQFFQAFSLGMEKMGSIEVKLGNQGEIRRDCNKTL